MRFIGSSFTLKMKGALETFDSQSFWLVVIGFVRAGKSLADWPASFWLGFHRLRPDLLSRGNY